MTGRIVGGGRGQSTSDLVLRADATADVGAGHAMRLLNLAEAWREGGGEVALVGRIELAFVRARAQELGVRLVSEAPAHADVVVVDNYDLETRSLFAQWPGALVRVLLDDVGDPTPGGYHVIWNPNAYGTTEMYREHDGVVIAGPDAVPVRAALPIWQPGGEGPVGVMLGGGRGSDVTHAAVRRLAERSDAEFWGVGDWVPREWRAIGARDPWGALARCASLITAAGSSVWESAAVGIPVVVVNVARNQRLIFDWARAAGAPGVDAEAAADAEALAEELASALPAATSLPRIAPGARHVARTLRRLAAEVAYAARG